MNPIQLFDTNLSSFTYLLFDESSRDALIIDPVDSQMERDLAPLRRYGLRLVWTEETHAQDSVHLKLLGNLKFGIVL